MRNCYFITGATGAIGSAIVPIVLKNPSNQVKLLIRANSSKEMSARLEYLFNFWGFQNNDTRKLRVDGLIGDTTISDFGLNREDYDLLTAECTHIIHCAGAVKMNLLIEDARKSAVGAAEQIIKLAKLCSELKKVEFVSTVGVKGKDREPLLETWITKHREFHNTYEQAKAEAEYIVQHEIEKGLPITVHRPSMVVGDSVTGKIIHYQVFYHICEFLSGKRTCGVFPYLGNGYLDTIPVDYVANAIYWSSQSLETVGKIFHLCSGTKQIALINLQNEVTKYFKLDGIGLPLLKVYLPLLFFRLFCPLLGVFAPQKIRGAIRSLPVFLNYLASKQLFSNQESCIIFSSAQIVVPEPELYIATVIQAYLMNRK